MQGVVLAATFAVSHNVEEAKPIAVGSATTSSLQRPYADRDWGVQQACTVPQPGLLTLKCCSSVMLPLLRRLLSAVAFPLSSCLYVCAYFRVSLCVCVSACVCVCRLEPHLAWCFKGPTLTLLRCCRY